MLIEWLNNSNLTSLNASLSVDQTQASFKQTVSRLTISDQKKFNVEYDLIYSFSSLEVTIMSKGKKKLENCDMYYGVIDVKR